MATRKFGNIEINYTPPAAQTQIYNTLGRSAATDTNSADSPNFLQKKWNSVENAIGTTGAAIISPINDAIQNTKTSNLLASGQQKMQDIAKKYGYSSLDDYYNALDTAEASGDTATYDRLMNTVQQDLINQANANSAAMKKNVAEYKDYVDNNYVSKKINQDRGKFLGSAMNTLSTAWDALSMAAGIPSGVITNGVQGAWEGVADELEQNGLDNFSTDRAVTNAITGAMAGGVVGALNGAIDKNLASKGGNLFADSNKLTQGLNNLGAKHNVASTLATGAGRGALSGAVGGAAGAAMQSAISGDELGQGIGNTLQGALSGAGQGAIIGGTMAGANMAARQGLNTLKQTGQAVGDFANRMQNADGNALQRFGSAISDTLNSGDSALGNKINDLRAGSDSGFGKRYNQFSGDAEKAIDYLIKRGGGEVEGAVRSPAVEAITGDGNIDLVYGKGGEDGYGLAHIVEKHGAEILSRLPDILENGKVYQKDGVSDRLYLKKDNDNSVLRLDWDGNKKQWVATAFEQNSPVSGSGGNPTASGVGTSPVNANDTTIEPIVPQNAQDVNRVGQYSKLPVSEIDDLLSKYNQEYDRLYNDTSVQRMHENADMADGFKKFLRNKDINNVVSDLAERRGDMFTSDREIAALMSTLRRNDAELQFALNRMNEAATQATPVSSGNDNKNTPETELYRALIGQNGGGVAPDETSAPARSIGQSTGGDQSVTSKEYRQIQRRNEALLEQYGTLSRRVTQAVNPAETVGKMADVGFTKPQDVENAVKYVTGSDGKLNILNKKVIASADPVNTWDGLTDGRTLTDFIDDQIKLNGLYGTNDAKAIKAEIEAQLYRLPSRREGSITYTDAAEDVFDVVQALEKHSANYKGKSGTNYSTATPYKDQKAAVLDAVSQVLKDRIYDSTDVSKVVTPEVVAELKAQYPKNEKWAQWVDNEVATAKSGLDLRAAQAPFVRMSKILDEQSHNAGTYGATVGKAARTLMLSNPVSMVVNGAEMLSNTNLGRRARASVYDKLAKRAAKNTTTATEAAITPVVDTTVATANAPSSAVASTGDAIGASPLSTRIYDVLGRYEGQEQARNAANDYIEQAAAQVNVVVPDTNGSRAVYNALTGGSGVGNVNSAYSTATTAQNGNMGGIGTTGDYWTDIIGAAMMAAAADNNASAFGQLYEMYQEAISDLTKTSSKDYSDLTNWSSSDRTKLLEAQDGLEQLNALEEAYNAAVGEGGGNAFQGNLRNLAINISGGNLDRAAANYNSLARSVGLAVVKNVINLGGTEADADRYLQYLPALTDTKDQAQAKLETLRRIYESQIKNLYGAYGVTG